MQQEEPQHPINPPEEPTPTNPTPDDPQDSEALNARLAEERQRAESFYASWQRAAADFANFKRRTEQERSEAAKFAGVALVLQLLPIVDDLERALLNVPKELGGLTWIDGVHIIYRKLMAVMDAQGVQPIETVGQDFDPNLHEAVMRAPGAEGKVLSELQRGYTLQGRVIRPSLVQVGTGESAPAEAPAAAENQPS